VQKKWELFVKSFITNEGYTKVIAGLENTVQIAFFGFLIGVALGTVVAIIKAFSKRSKAVKAISLIGDAYVAFFRGTPIVVQLLIAYYVIAPLFGVRINALLVGILTFGLNSGAYVSEIMRSGILSVDVGQMEAGRSLGLSFSATMRKIVLPQALKNSLPALGNELIAITKETSVAGFITVLDLTEAFKQIGSANYEFIIPYLMLALVYLVIVLIMTLFIKLLERRLRRSDKRN